MKDREPTVRSRELGEGLRRAMEYAGFSMADLARQLDWSSGRVSRLLAGKRGGSGFDVMAVVTACGIKGDERDRLMSLALDHDRPGWFVQHGPVVPKQVQTLIDHETKATTISHVQTALIPGLLQTGDYARAVISNCVNVPVDEVDDRVSARLARHNLLSRDRPPKFSFFVHEFALRTPVGGALVMSEQLHELLRWSVRPFLTLRVIPVSLGAHAAMSGNFTLMDIPTFKPIVYLDSETSSLFLETPIEIDAYRNILVALEDTALDEGQSRELIESIAIEYEAGRHDYDGLA